MGCIKADDLAPDPSIRPMGRIRTDDPATGRYDSPTGWVIGPRMAVAALCGRCLGG